MKLNSKKLLWDILGTIFLGFLLVSFSWNYYARQKETELFNQLVGSVIFGPRTIAGAIEEFPNVARQVLDSLY